MLKVPFGFIILFLAALSGISQNLYSQNLENSNEVIYENGFKFDKQNKSVTWEKIYQVDTLIQRSDITTFLLNNSIIKIISENEIGIVGELIPTMVDYKNMGYKWSNAPVIFNNHEITSNFLIQFKPGKYKITLNRIGFRDKQGILLPKGEILFINGTFSFRDDGTVRTRNSLIFEILNKHFEDKLTFKKVKTGNW